MQSFCRAIVAVLALSLSGQVCAQFRRPPPDRPAPSCSQQNASPTVPEWDRDAICENGDRSQSTVVLSCSSFNASLMCTATMQRQVDEDWFPWYPPGLIYDWALNVDKQEYYLSPSNDAAITIDCGFNPDVYVRVTAAGSTAMAALKCALSTSDPVVEPGME
jgi:hypothetical protein